VDAIVDGDILLRAPAGGDVQIRRAKGRAA
jgi:hypothetical protein